MFLIKLLPGSWDTTNPHTHSCLCETIHNPYIANTGTRVHARVLTGVEKDHGLEADVLLPLQLELSHSGRGGYEHIKDLGEALHAAPLLSGVRHKMFTEEHEEGKGVLVSAHGGI